MGGGRGGIRTLEACYRLRDFQSRALGQAMRPFQTSFLAERVGFEPTEAHHLTAFRERHLQPLGHLSKPMKYTNGIPYDDVEIALETRKPPGGDRAAIHGTPGRIRTCGLWVRNPTLYPLSYRRVLVILHQNGNDPPGRAVWGGKGGIRTLGALFQRSTA